MTETSKLPGLPGLFDIRVRRINVDAAEFPDIEAELVVREDLLNVAGTVHGATVVALADTACGYGCLASLPSGKTGFTTLELKTNYLGAARLGDSLIARAHALHRGSSTQVWDATVVAEDGNSGRQRTVAEFRCTQYLLGS